MARSLSVAWLVSRDTTVSQKPVSALFKFKTTTTTCSWNKTKKKMRPDKSESFTFHKTSNQMAAGDGNLTKLQNCRRKLQDKFEDSSGSSTATSRSVLSSLSLDETRKVIRNGSERVSKAFSSFRTSFGTFSQVGWCSFVFMMPRLFFFFFIKNRVACLFLFR